MTRASKLIAHHEAKGRYFVRDKANDFNMADFAEIPDLKQADIIAWFNTSKIPAGYGVIELTPHDLAWLAIDNTPTKDIFRIVSSKHTNIVKIDTKSGRIYALDSQYYLDNDKIKFEKTQWAYRSLIIEPTNKALKAFNKTR